MQSLLKWFAVTTVFLTPGALASASQPGAKVQPNSEVEVNIYAKGPGPVYHAGIVIGQAEHYFDSDNHVKAGDVRHIHGWHHIRTVRRTVAKTHEQVVESFNKVRSEWDGTRYDLTQHSCVWFVQAVLEELQVEGLDREYLRNSGFQKIGLVPGSSTLTELLKLKNGADSVRLVEAGTADLEKLARLPEDTLRETGEGAKDVVVATQKAVNDTEEAINKAGKDVSNEAKAAGSKVSESAKAGGKKVAKATKSAGKKLSGGAKAAGNKVSNAAKSTGKKASDGAKQAGGKVARVFKRGF